MILSHQVPRFFCILYDLAINQIILYLGVPRRGGGHSRLQKCITMNKKIIILLCFILVSSHLGFQAAAQNKSNENEKTTMGGIKQIAIKNNLLYTATASLNLGVEVGLSQHWSFDLSGNFNAWSKNDSKKWKHWFIQPEARYWFCDIFSRHFLSAHLLAGAFNLGGLQNNISFLGTDFSLLSNTRYQGYAFGGGIGYGYAFMLNKHWNFELEGAIGYLFLDYERFKCAGCGKKIGEGNHNYFGPTKMSVNLIYLF